MRLPSLVDARFEGWRMITVPTGDLIALRERSSQEAGQRIEGWTGPWPPPQVLVVATEIASGGNKVLNPDDQRPGDIAWMQDNPGIWHLAWYELHRLGEPANARLHVVGSTHRRAEYTRIGGRP